MRILRSIAMGFLGLCMLVETRAPAANVTISTKRFTGTANNRKITLSLPSQKMYSVGTNLFLGLPQVVQPVNGIVTVSNLPPLRIIFTFDAWPTPVIARIPEGNDTYWLQDIADTGIDVVSSTGSTNGGVDLATVNAAVVSAINEANLQTAWPSLDYWGLFYPTQFVDFNAAMETWYRINISALMPAAGPNITAWAAMAPAQAFADYATTNWVLTQIEGLSSPTNGTTPTQVTNIVDAKIAPLASTATLNQAIAPLVTTTSVNQAIAPLATTTSVNQAIAPLATTSSVTQAVAPLVDTNALAAALAAKADLGSVTLSGSSTNAIVGDPDTNNIPDWGITWPGLELWGAKVPWSLITGAPALGSGDITAAGDNVLSGSNTITGPTFITGATVNTATTNYWGSGTRNTFEQLDVAINPSITNLGKILVGHVTAILYNTNTLHVGTGAGTTMIDSRDLVLSNALVQGVLRFVTNGFAGLPTAPSTYGSVAVVNSNQVLYAVFGSQTALTWQKTNLFADINGLTAGQITNTLGSMPVAQAVHSTNADLAVSATGAAFATNSIVLTNAVNTGMIPWGKTTFTNLGGNITVLCDLPTDFYHQLYSTVVLTNGTSTDYKATFLAVSLSTNSFVLGQDVWVTNKSKVIVALSYVFGDTNGVAARFPQR